MILTLQSISYKYYLGNKINNLKYNIIKFFLTPICLNSDFFLS